MRAPLSQMLHGRTDLRFCDLIARVVIVLKAREKEPKQREEPRRQQPYKGHKEGNVISQRKI